MKISVIMQSYLGEYPGARSNPKYKFIRAVNSFLLQKHTDKELVIVSDGCEDTKRLYEECFSSFANIKFAYVGRSNLPRTYEVKEGKKHFRGLPREVGRALTDADLVTYMDADDVMMPSRLSHINAGWQNTDASRLWSYSTVALEPKNDAFNAVSNDDIDLRLFGFPIDTPVRVHSLCPPGHMTSAPWLIVHRPQARAKWQDTFDVLDDNGKKISGSSEDVRFVDDLYKESPGYKYDSPTYVLCHRKSGPSGKGAWDI